MTPTSHSLPVSRAGCTNMAEQIEVLLGELGNTVSYGVQISPTDSMRLSPNYFGHMSYTNSYV